MTYKDTILFKIENQIFFISRKIFLEKDKIGLFKGQITTLLHSCRSRSNVRASKNIVSYIDFNRWLCNTGQQSRSKYPEYPT